MAMYATGSQFTGAQKRQTDQNAVAKDYLRQQGQAAPQQGNYAGGQVRDKPVRADQPMPQRTQLTHGGQPTQAGSTRNKPVRAGVIDPTGGLGRPTQPTPRAQPQVRDRAFNMSEQAYRAGGMPQNNAVLTAAPLGTTVTMAGPNANQAGLANMLPVGALNNVTSTNSTGKSAFPAQFTGSLPAYTPGGNPVAGMSVLGGGNGGKGMSEGGAGTAGKVQTRRYAYIAGTGATNPDAAADQAVTDDKAFGQNGGWGSTIREDPRLGWWEDQSGFDFGRDGLTIYSDYDPITPSDMADQDADIARGIGRGIADGPGGTTVAGEIGREAFGRDVDPNGGNNGGNQSPFTSFAEWLATMIGEPFGAAATKLNEYGRKTKDAYYNDWEDLAPLQDVGLQLMDPRYTEAYENAARNRMQTSIGQERDQAARDLMGQAGRGGAIGTGRETGINNAAMRAMMEGEQRLLEDSFRRKLASQQLGAGIYGDAQRAKYGALEGGDISPGELAGIVIPAAMDMGGSALEALGGAAGGGPGPIPFLDLFFGG